MHLILFFMSWLRFLEQGMQFYLIQLTIKLQHWLLTPRNQVAIVIHCTNVPWNVMLTILWMISSGQYITKRDATIYQSVFFSQLLTAQKNSKTNYLLLGRSIHISVANLRSRITSSELRLQMNPGVY